MPNPYGDDAYFRLGWNPGFAGPRSSIFNPKGISRNIVSGGARWVGRELLKGTSPRGLGSLLKIEYKLQRALLRAMQRNKHMRRIPFKYRKRAVRYATRFISARGSKAIRRFIGKKQQGHEDREFLYEALGGSRMARYYPRRRRFWSYGRTRRWYRGKSYRYGRRRY